MATEQSGRRRAQEILAREKALRTRAFQLLGKALDADEKRRYTVALQLYRHTLDELERLLALRSDDVGIEDADLTPQFLQYQARAMGYYAQVTDRVAVLERGNGASSSIEHQIKRLNAHRTPIHEPSTTAAATTSSTSELDSIDAKHREAIERELVDASPGVRWGDIVGLDEAKDTLKEMVIFPLLRPDLFTGIRSPPKGLLLFGPPGTGKSLLAKAVASESSARFYHVRVSTLTQKYLGEGEKMVRALFTLARANQPSVIFIDEIDSLLQRRTDDGHEATLRLKNEFFEQMDGVSTRNGADRVVVLGATNRPQALDDAALRRLTKHVHIALPCAESRAQMLANLLETIPNALSEDDRYRIAASLDGYSGSDIFALTSEAARLPLRELGERIVTASIDSIRSVGVDDFTVAQRKIRATVSSESIAELQEWSDRFGT